MKLEEYHLYDVQSKRRFFLYISFINEKISLPKEFYLFFILPAFFPSFYWSTKQAQIDQKNNSETPDTKLEGLLGLNDPLCYYTSIFLNIGYCYLMDYFQLPKVLRQKVFNLLENT